MLWEYSTNTEFISKYGALRVIFKTIKIIFDKALSIGNSIIFSLSSHTIYKLYLKIPVLKRAGILSLDRDGGVMQIRDTFIEKIRGKRDSGVSQLISLLTIIGLVVAHCSIVSNLQFI